MPADPTLRTITVDDEALRVIVSALDLLQRVAMGQWRVVPEHAPNVVDPFPFSPVGDAVLAARCGHTTNQHLRHPGASLAIRAAGREAMVACDVWHLLGGGMPSRQTDRLTDVTISVS
jgi:hypothetical protein